MVFSANQGSSPTDQMTNPEMMKEEARSKLGFDPKQREEEQSESWE
jgi:hypothetical protein